MTRDAEYISKYSHSMHVKVTTHVHVHACTYLQVHELVLDQPHLRHSLPQLRVFLFEVKGHLSQSGLPSRVILLQAKQSKAKKNERKRDTSLHGIIKIHLYLQRQVGSLLKNCYDLTARVLSPGCGIFFSFVACTYTCTCICINFITLYQQVYLLLPIAKIREIRRKPNPREKNQCHFPL